MAQSGLDPSILSRLSPGLGYSDPTSGRMYQMLGGQRSGESNDGGDPTGYMSYDPNHHAIGDPYTMYNPDGSYKTDTKFEDTNSGEGLWQLAFAAAMGGGLAMDSGLVGAGTNAAPTAGSNAVNLAGNAGYDSTGLAANTSAGTGLGTSTGGVGTGGGGMFSDLGYEPVASADGGIIDSTGQVGGYGSSGLAGTGSGGFNSITGGTPSAVGTAGSSLLGKIPGAIGSLGASGLGKVISGGVDLNNQTHASNDMLGWLKGQQAKIDNLYTPGSPEYNALWQQMSAKDAAAGRNSQYGPRSVDLAAHIAQIKADETQRLTTGVSAAYAAALNRKAGAGTGLSTAIGNLSNGSNSFDWTKYFGNGTGTMSGTNIPVGTDLSTLNGDNAPGGKNFGNDLGFDDPTAY